MHGRDNTEDRRVDGEIILEWIFERQCEEVWTGCIWLKTGIGGGPL
jgi:hypothetical protein